MNHLTALQYPSNRSWFVVLSALLPCSFVWAFWFSPVSRHAHDCSPALFITCPNPSSSVFSCCFSLISNVCFVLVLCIAVKWRSGFLFLCSYCFIYPFTQLLLLLPFIKKSFLFSIHFMVSVEACSHYPERNEQIKAESRETGNVKGDETRGSTNI